MGGRNSEIEEPDITPGLLTHFDASDFAILYSAWLLMSHDECILSLHDLLENTSNDIPFLVATTTSPPITHR